MFDYCIPKELSISSEAILGFYKQIESKKLPLHCAILYRKGHILSEAYFAPFQKVDLHRMFSITKSLTSIAIGRLESLGRISLEDRIVTYFGNECPFDVKDVLPKESDYYYLSIMTIRDMLMMRTCHANSTYNKFDLSSDWVASFFTTRPTHPAGMIFTYDTSAAHVLAALVERLTGMSLCDFVRSEFPELQLSDEMYCLADGQGVSMGGTGLMATPDDILKLGILLMNHGLWQKEDGSAIRLLPEEFVISMTTLQTANCVAAPLPSEASGYGYMTWITERGGFVLYGMGGQLVICDPDTETILVTCSDTQGYAGGNQIIYDAFYRLLSDSAKAGKITSCRTEIPIKTDRSYSQTHDYSALLRDYESAAKVLPFSPFGLPSVPATDGGYERMKALMSEIPHEGKLATNSARRTFSGFAFEKLCGRGYRLILYGMDQSDKYLFDFDFGNIVTFSFPIYNDKTYGSAYFTDENTLILVFRMIGKQVGSVHMEFAFAPGRTVLYMKKIEETLYTEFQGHYIYEN